jgi:trimethylamine-N-oxide reductase (cytochrome c)
MPIQHFNTSICNLERRNNLKEKQNKLPDEKEEKKQSGEVSRRDFLVGAGTVVVGGAVGAGLLSSCGDGEEKTITTTIEKTKTVTTTVGEGVPVTVTETTQVGAGETVTRTTTSIQTVGGVEPWQEEEKTVLKSVTLGGIGGDPMAVDVKNGKVVRIRPLHFNETGYTEEELDKSRWYIEARGKRFDITDKTLPPYFAIGYKKRIYSKSRVKYPLQRVDWDPEGERNPQNRGKSKYRRITWDKALTMMANEINRVKETYGPYAVLCIGEDGHKEDKGIHQTAGCHKKLLKYYGGYTRECRNADSWEGWYWGAMHLWGTGSNGLAQAPFGAVSVLKDVSENCEMLIAEGADWETTPVGFGGQGASRLCFWFTELGIKQIDISPDLNYQAAVHADKWIPILPNTDMALQIAIANVWFKEGTYDKEYVETHCVGMDKYEAYVTGVEDGIDKTPAWAAPLCGVPEYTIKALAREWAKKATTCQHYFGSVAERGPYTHETSRLEGYLLAMQGLGKPGRQQIFNRSMQGPDGTPLIKAMVANKRAESEINQPQQIPRTQVHLSIMDGSSFSWGSTTLGYPVEDQFIKYVYPIPASEGGSEFHMLWSEKPCNIACWNDGNYFIEAIRNPKIECYVVNLMWMENDALFADIVLPITTKFEENDIGVSDFYGGEWRNLNYQEKAIEPIGESISDYNVVERLAEKLGIYDQLSEGKTAEEWVKSCVADSRIAEYCSWDQLVEKKFYAPPVDWNKWNTEIPGFTMFYQDPENNPLGTPSGKLEIYSQRLADNFPDDNERGPMAKWIIGGPASEGWTHDESLHGERAKLYPYLTVSNHPRWRHHVQGDDISWIREIPTCKIRGYDGYLYEPIWISPTDAAKEGIVHGDILEMYNERGIELGAAYVTERIIPGATYMDHGSRPDFITDKINRGGSGNPISPRMGLSKNCWGMASSGYLVGIRKCSPEQMDEWRRTYPEAFAREYDPGSGLTCQAYMEDEV